MHRGYAMPAHTTGLAREAIDVWLRLLKTVRKPK
jgi:hypothetical protein